MQGPRIPESNEFSKVVDFLNDQLRPDQNWSISHEYPTALNPNNMHNMRIITEDEKVISHAVLKPIIVKTPVCIFKIAAIGSVVTQATHRGQGFSTKVIEECLAEAKAQDCDLSILWTNLYDFYRKLGFELAGNEVSFVIDQELGALSPTYRYLDTHQVSSDAILRLYNQHTVTNYRTSEDIRKYLQIPNTHVYTAWDASGQLAAYAVEGKGADLTDYIHEWGGGVSALQSLLTYIFKTKKRAFTLIAPTHSINLIARLDEHGFVKNEGYLGMLKIINLKSLSTKVGRYVQSRGVKNFKLEKTETGLIFQVDQTSINLNSEQELLKLLFGPSEYSEELTELFPLPLWIWGWDSI